MVVARHTIQLGALLTILGTGTFALMASFMAGSLATLVPAVFGLVFLGLGIFAMKRKAWQRPLIHVAIALSLLTVVGMLPGLAEAWTLLGGGTVSQPATALQQSITALICLGFAGRAATVLRTHRI